MSEHPTIERLRELNDSKLRFVVKFASLQLQSALEAGEEMKAGTYTSILEHVSQVLDERMVLAAIEALVGQYRAAELMLRGTS